MAEGASVRPGPWEAPDFYRREKTARTKAEQIRAIIAAYDFTQPRNGPNNRPLSGKTLDAFCCEHGGGSTTDYLVVVGPQTAWPEHAVRRRADFRDGLSNTIVVVEALGSDIRWSEPRDLHFASINFQGNDQTAPGIKGPFPDAANAAFADGSVRTLATEDDPMEIKAMFTVNGQE